jgi:dTDP-4-amino-4,6-dideoxygalactose transaminase
MINVTKTYLPSFEDYCKQLKRAWDKGWITNNGELVQELEKKLKEQLGVKHLFFCNNGTIVLQMALKALNLKKEIITTPFSYVATTTAILWENCTPVFVDISDRDFNIDADKIEAAITKDTEAILATHVYGNPCDVEKIEAIAKKHNLKVIYDGAHAFAVNYKNKPLLGFGDVSTCSFHATKLFHTVEGGAIITNDDEVANKLMLYRQFGHVYDDYFSIGINGKNSEFHAAMGVTVLPLLDKIMQRRKLLSELYDRLLKELQLKYPVALPGTEYNYGYYPVVLKNEADLLKVKEALAAEQINTRRYFFPSLNELPYITKKYACPVSEDISRRVLCLPLYPDLEESSVEKICSVVNAQLKK